MPAAGATPHGDGGIIGALGADGGALGIAGVSGRREAVGELGGGVIPNDGAGRTLPKEGAGGAAPPNEGGGRIVDGIAAIAGGIRSIRGDGSSGPAAFAGDPNAGGGIIGGAAWGAAGEGADEGAVVADSR